MNIKSLFFILALGTASYVTSGSIGAPIGANGTIDADAMRFIQAENIRLYEGNILLRKNLGLTAIDIRTSDERIPKSWTENNEYRKINTALKDEQKELKAAKEKFDKQNEPEPLPARMLKKIAWEVVTSPSTMKDIYGFVKDSPTAQNVARQTTRLALRGLVPQPFQFLLN